MARSLNLDDAFEDILRGHHGVGKVQQLYGPKGFVQHVSNSKCVPTSQNGEMLDESQPSLDHTTPFISKRPAHATKQMLDKAMQLHSSNNRDIVILMRYDDDRGDEKFSYWGSPGIGEDLLRNSNGASLQSIWESLSSKGHTTTVYNVPSFSSNWVDWDDLRDMFVLVLCNPD